LGFGTDSLGNEISYAQGYLGERDEVRVETIGPDTITTITASETTVQSGGSVDLTVTEQNTGNDPLTDPYVEVWKDGTLLATLIAPPDSGDIADPGVLNVGETWSWTISSGPITTTTTFVALGFGTDSLGNEISYAQGYLGERDDVRVDIECTGCLQICKYEDKNGNGQREDDEPWLSGWEFIVTDSDDNSWSVTTDATGSGGFSADGLECCCPCPEPPSCETPCLYLPLGQYSVTEVSPLPDGWTNTDPGDGSLTKTATVECDKTTRVDFGNQKEERGQLRIKKVDKCGRLLGGAEFLIDPNPKTGVGSLTVIDNGLNDEDPTEGVLLVTDCLKGITCTVTETVAPPGYTPASPKTVTIACERCVKFVNYPEKGSGCWGGCWSWLSWLWRLLLAWR
jgi:hypothetical protein